MSRALRSVRKALGWEAVLLAVPVVALAGFGFLALRWERQAQEEDLRARCRALVEPMRRAFFDVLEANNLLEGVDLGPRPNELPLPAEPGDSLAKFEAGEFATVLGEAGELSEAGLPLRPLAAYRLMMEETDSERLAELTNVIAAERSIVTSRLFEETEARHHELGLALPPVLEGWRERLAKEERVRGLLGGRSPESLLVGEGPVIRLEGGNEKGALVRVPDGVVLVDRSVLSEASKAALQYCPSAGVEVPHVFGVGVDAWSQSGQGLPETARIMSFVRDDAFPSIVFWTSAASLDRFTGRRQRVFVIFLVSAAFLAVAGLLLIRRTVARERELAERKGNLVAAVSHEMRTPVASIRLMAENLANGTVKAGEKRERHLRRLVEQSERLSTLVENVLSFSRREAGKEKRRDERIDVGELLEEAMGQCRALAEEREVTLNRAAEEFESAPVGDSEALRQALVNLLDNAIKHSPASGEVRCGAEALDDDRWRLWVEDEGPGVAIAEREKVFEAFYRVGSELRRETTGTGLGLALVKQVAELHGGEAVCREAPGGGARFELVMPLNPANPPSKRS